MNTIRIEVEVPEELEVGPSDINPRLNKVGVPGCYWHFPTTQEGVVHDWQGQVCQQIAAAVEARKPRPPKFQVGGVVEWSDESSHCAGVIRKVDPCCRPYRYFVNHEALGRNEADLTLVRRAAK